MEYEGILEDFKYPEPPRQIGKIWLRTDKGKKVMIVAPLSDTDVEYLEKNKGKKIKIEFSHSE